LLIGLLLVAGCPKKEGAKPTGNTEAPGAKKARAEPASTTPGAEKATGGPTENPATEPPAAQPAKATADEPPEKATPEKATPEKATEAGAPAKPGTGSGEEGAEAAPAEKPAKAGIAIDVIPVDCEQVCAYQLDCAADAQKSAGKPVDESATASARNACKMACEAAMKGGEPLATKSYRAATACLGQPCGKAYTQCLTGLLKAR